jgi:hypothetical protein
MASEHWRRGSGLALLVGGLAMSLFVLLLYPVGGFFGAAHAHHPLWAPAHFLHFVGAVAILLGLVGLYAVQAGQLGLVGRVGFVLAFVGTAQFVGTGMLTAFVWPVLADLAPGSLEPQGALFLPPATFVFALTIGCLIPGYVLFAWASLRAGRLPRGGLVLLAVGAVLALLPPEPVGPLPWITLILGGLLFGGGAMWLGWALWVGVPTAEGAARSDPTGHPVVSTRQ